MTHTGELDAMRREVARGAQLATTLQEVTAALTRAGSVSEVAEVVTGLGARLFGATASLLYLLDGDRMRLVRGAGVSDDRMAPWASVPLDRDEPLSAAIRSGTPLFATDRATLLERWPHLGGVDLQGAPLQAVVTLPLIARGATVGGLAFSFYVEPAIDTVQRDFFLTIADMCAHVLDRARALDAEREAHEALRRHQDQLALLARAGEKLSSMLDARAAIVELARLVVPTLADWCAIDEVGPDGRLVRLAVEHVDPAKVALAHELARRYPPNPTADRGVHAVLRTGRTDYLPELPDELLVAAAVDEEHLKIVRALGLSSYATVPIVARSGILGALTLVGEGSRRLSEDDVRVGEELARRAGLALENARLFASAEAARAELHRLFMGAPAAIAIVKGPEHRYELANQPYQRLAAGARLIGSPLREVAGPVAASLGDIVDEVYQTGQVVTATELAIGHVPTRWVDVVCQPTRDVAFRVDGVAIFAFDVTERVEDRTELRHAEEAARSQADTLATVNELGRTISAELDRQKVVQAVTDAATRLTRAQFGAFFYNVVDDTGGKYVLYTISGVPREAFSKFPMPRNTKVFAPTFDGEGVVRVGDITQDPRYGHNRPYHGMPEGHLPVRSYLAAPVMSRSGEVVGGLFFGHSEPDVFDERAEALVVGLAAQAAVAVDNARLFEEAQRLIRALEQTNKDLDQFAYATSHDLKAPLRGIASLSEWIEEDLGDALTDEVRDKMNLLRGRVNRMDALIAGILAFSRAGRDGGARSDVDVAQLLSEITDLLSPAPPARILVEGPVPTLWGERVALQQVFLNLVGNALKHAQRPDVTVRVSARATGDWWEFRVADDGPGIDPSFHERVWGIFQTLAPRDEVEATGIGLSIVRKIVESRGGRVWIEQDSAPGATFGFTWPGRDDRRGS